jgi:DNA-binding LacI/PurR family transcriptional regulator
MSTVRSADGSDLSEERNVPAVAPTKAPRSGRAPVERKRAPAMTDVARLAGVSHQTVSRVMNGHPNVTPQTRVRVLSAIAELGYRPNRAAKALVTGRSQVVGIVAQNTVLYGPVSILCAVERAVADAGYAVGVVSVPVLDRTSIAEAVGRLLDQRVGGIVVIAPVASANDALDELPSDLPVVAIDGDRRRPMPLVTVDQQMGARLATRHLLDAGHETVWHVAGPEEWFDAADRLAGWREALTEAGAEVPPVIAGDWSLAAGYRAGQMLARIPDARAVFAANDHLAIGILKALRESGRVVPDDVSIVGFDDIPEAGYLTPPLTTIRPDFAAVGAKTVELLRAQMERRPEGLVRTDAAAPLLVTRDSVAPPRAPGPRRGGTGRSRRASGERAAQPR